MCNQRQRASITSLPCRPNPTRPQLLIRAMRGNIRSKRAIDHYCLPDRLLSDPESPLPAGSPNPRGRGISSGQSSGLSGPLPWALRS